MASYVHHVILFFVFIKVYILYIFCYLRNLALRFSFHGSVWVLCMLIRVHGSRWCLRQDMLSETKWYSHTERVSVCLTLRKGRVISARIDDHQQVNPNTNLSVKTTRHTGSFFGNCCQARVLFVNTCLYRLASGGLELLLKVKRSKVRDLLCLCFWECIIHWICLFAVCFVFPLRASCLKRRPSVFVCVSPDNTHAADTVFQSGCRLCAFFLPQAATLFVFVDFEKLYAKTWDLNI